MPPCRRYSPLGDPSSCSMDELDFQRWLTERKIPVFQALGLDHTMASLRPVARGAKLECPVCIKDGVNETVQTSNENKKHRHELSKKHSEAIALLLGVDPAALMPEDYVCDKCSETFNRRDSLNRHLAAKTCSKVQTQTITAEGIAYKRRLRRAAVRISSLPSSRDSSEEWPSPALPYPLSLPSPSRSQSPPTPLYHAPTMFSYSSDASSPGYPASSSMSPSSSTSRSASPPIPAADEFYFAFESVFQPAEAVPVPAAPVPSPFDEGIGFDAYRPLEDNAFPVCALATDFSPVQPMFGEPAMIDLLNLTLEDFTFDAAPEFHQSSQATDMPLTDNCIAILCSDFQ